MDRKKIISYLILLILSLIPFFAVMYIWFSIPSDIEIGGVFYILGIPVLLPFIVGFVFITYKILEKVFGLSKISLAMVIIIPLFINIFSTQWYFIKIFTLRTQYFNQYEGMNLQVEFVEDELIPLTSSVYNFAAIYKYKIILNNRSSKQVDNVDMRVTLEYEGGDKYSSYIAQDIFKTNLAPGPNVIEREMKLDTGSLRCGYIKNHYNSPLKFFVTQNILNRDKIFPFKVDPSIREELIIINDGLEVLNKNDSIPIRECLD